MQLSCSSTGCGIKTMVYSAITEISIERLIARLVATDFLNAESVLFDCVCSYNVLLSPQVAITERLIARLIATDFLNAESVLFDCGCSYNVLLGPQALIRSRPG
mgnify:CR=1 FL=1